MIFFLYGPDTYRSRQKLKEIIENYKKIHKSGLNFQYLDSGKLDYQDFKNEFQSVSMFDEKKLLVLENVSQNKDFQDKFLENIKKFSGSENIIVFYEERGISDDKFFTSLKKIAKSQEFNYLEGQKLTNWIKKEFSNHQTIINEKGIGALINFVGNDLWQLSNEIQKLVAYKKKEKKIGEEEINLLVSPKIENDIFKTIDAIMSKNKKQALSLINKHLEKGDDPLYLLSMINFQFRNILIVKDLIEKNKPYYAILKQSGLHPFVVKKSYQQAEKFTIQQLKKIYQKIFQVDISIKTGKIMPDAALNMLVAEL